MVLRATGDLDLPLDSKLYEIKGRIILKWMGNAYRIHVTQARDKWPVKGICREHTIK